MGCLWKVRGFSIRNRAPAKISLALPPRSRLLAAMKTKSLLAALSATFLCAGLHAGTPAQEKEFVDKYKAAFEKGDTDTLESFLYIKDAHPMALQFYKMMQSDGAGRAKISSIELLDLTPEDVKKASEIQTGPDGSKTQLPLKPTKKLKINLDRKDSSDKTVTSTTSFIAEKDGKYVIPVPAAVK
jgi:hypothetical protein